MKIRLGVDVACRAAHQVSCADEHGVMLWVGHRFRTDPDELEALWRKLPPDAAEVMVVMEPTRNAWVALAAWFRRHGATVVMIPPEQSADLRAYYAKHAKTDRLDSKTLARLPLLHPEGLHREDTLGPGEMLKRAVKVRSGLVHRRTTSMARLDALLECGILRHNVVDEGRRHGVHEHRARQIFTAAVDHFAQIVGGDLLGSAADAEHAVALVE